MHGFAACIWSLSPHPPPPPAFSLLPSLAHRRTHACARVHASLSCAALRCTRPQEPGSGAAEALAALLREVQSFSLDAGVKEALAHLGDRAIKIL